MPISESKGAAASDGELVQKAKEGSTSAFDALVVKYRKKVYAIAFGMTRNHSDADDVAQETFFRAYRALSSFRPGYEFRPWLLRIAVNQSINCLKRKGRRLEVSLEEEVGSGIVTDVQFDNPGYGLEQKELAARIEAAVQRLSPKLRAVFLLRAGQDLSYEEMAKILRISKGTVMSRLSRAREKVKGMVGEYGENTE